MRFWRPDVRFDPWKPGRNANDKPISIVSFHPTSEIPCFYHVSHNSFIWKVAMNTGTVSDPAGCFCSLITKFKWVQMQGWVVTHPWGLVHSTNTYMRIFVIQLQSATVGSLLVLRLWWKTIRSRVIECCFHCFVFSQSGNSHLISAKKIRQANFIHWQNTGKYQFNKALLWFPTQGRRICMHLYAFVGFESSLSGRSAYTTWQKHPQKMRWVDSSDSFSPGRALALVTLGRAIDEPKVHEYI